MNTPLAQQHFKALVGMALGSILFGAAGAFADDAPAASQPTNQAAPSAEEVEVDSIKQKYWARGEETEMGVVQNRLFSKARRISLGIAGGVTSSDPFLSIKNLWLSAGFHFNEYFGLSFIANKTWAGASSALLTFEENRGATANTNKPQYYLGVEALGSLLYGKLSLVGLSIIYYDFHVSGGLGMTATESGKNLTPSVGVGQRFYISRFVSLRADYRMMYYRESILEKEIPTKLGQEVGQRDTFNHSMALGLDFFIGGGKK